jgi:hypothetical protein
VIKTVLDLKGSKRFKKYNFGPEAAGLDDLDIRDLDINKAKTTFKKMNNRSAYGSQFGVGPLSKDDYKVSPAYFKTLCSLLKSEAAGYIEKWLKIND